MPELNYRAARLARAAADEFAAQRRRPRFVAGALGPTNRMASLSPDVNDPGFRSVTFDQLVVAYLEAARGLLLGGVDLLLIETIIRHAERQGGDLRGAHAVRRDRHHAAADDLGHDHRCLGTACCRVRRPRRSGTRSGTRNRCSSGSTARSAAGSCGPTSRSWRGGRRYLRVRLPERRAAERLRRVRRDPDGDRRHPARVRRGGLVNIVGGCCGTTPEHIRLVRAGLTRCAPRKLPPLPVKCRLSGLEPLNIDEDSLFVNVGERTNVTGSAKFRKLIEADDYAAALEVARQQVASGAQIIDVNMDEGMLDSESRHDALPEPDRRRAGHRARAGHDRFLQVVGASRPASSACRASRSSTRSA